MTEQQETINDLYKLVEWTLSDDTGVSSKTICRHMLGLECKKYTYPCDEWDRGRCIRLLSIMPHWIKRLHEMEIYHPEWKIQVDLILKELSK